MNKFNVPCRKVRVTPSLMVSLESRSLIAL